MRRVGYKLEDGILYDVCGVDNSNKLHINFCLDYRTTIKQTKQVKLGDNQ